MRLVVATMVMRGGGGRITRGRSWGLGLVLVMVMVLIEILSGLMRTRTFGEKIEAGLMVRGGKV